MRVAIRTAQPPDACNQHASHTDREEEEEEDDDVEERALEPVLGHPRAGASWRSDGTRLGRIISFSERTERSDTER